MIQARNCRVTSLTCVSGKVLKTIIKNGTPLYPKDYLIGSNQQLLHRKIMSRSISISGHVKLTDRQEQVIEHMWTFKEPLERCQRLPISLLSMKTKHCHRLKPAKTLNKIWNQHSSLQSANWIMKINSSIPVCREQDTDHLISMPRSSLDHRPLACSSSTQCQPKAKCTQTPILLHAEPP